jgi:hypothetical protein
MKTIIHHFAKVFIVSTAVVFLSFTTATVVHQPKKETAFTQLQFVGKFENLPVFRLVLFNESSTTYLIRVKEGNDQVLFSETIKGNSVSRLYKLDTESTDMINSTTFEVTNQKSGKTTVYQLKDDSETVEEVSVTKW